VLRSYSLNFFVFVYLTPKLTPAYTVATCLNADALALRGILRVPWAHVVDVDLPDDVLVSHGAILLFAGGSQMGLKVF
jgi:hypothetical protein